MLAKRSVIQVARRAAVSATPLARRGFATTMIQREEVKSAPAAAPKTPAAASKGLSEIRTADDLFGVGAQPGTIPTDLEQSTGLERLEILSKMEGFDLFDMTPLDATRKGTLQDPIMVTSAGPEQYAGCTGLPAGSHPVLWLTMTKERPVERCPECGSVYKMDYVGPEEDPHDHHHHESPEAPGETTFANFVKPEYL
ncbi:putative cytochrome c oxidase polypeptide iv protein [Ceratocystis lukuohia]|uniref:Cytochrome c oxidase polypeptide iv protein n=1 Tax=Ceratocystis lukuohia TaxID=2019550 RepID=A0ABR4MJS3_9PEZI